VEDDLRQPIYRGDRAHSKSRGVKDLIKIEWAIIDKLLALTENASYEKHRSLYYQTLASHIRTLSKLLKMHGQSVESEDLAKLLAEIRKEAKRIARRLRLIEKRTRKACGRSGAIR